MRANATTATWVGTSFPMQIDLSVAPVDYTAISTTWNNNHGIDRATVFNGTHTVPAGTSATGTPGPFYLTIPVSPPFLYNPNLGDRVIDTTHSGNTPASMPTLDAVSTAGAANAKRVYSLTNPPAATATAWTGDLANVLEFTFVPAAGLTASFTVDVTGGASPLAVNFTSTSFSSAPGGITGDAWDFDGDTVTDSMAQNPVWAYANTNPVNVSLTVTRLCSPPSTVTRVVVPSQSLTTNLVSNNGGSSLWTIYFDANVLNLAGIEISTFDSITSTLSTAFTVDVYLKQVSYVGSEFVPAAWTQVGVASGTSNAVANQTSNAVLAQPLCLPPGQHGVALRHAGISPRYVTGAATYGNGDLSLTLGAFGVATAGPFATGTLMTSNADAWIVGS